MVADLAAAAAYQSVRQRITGYHWVSLGLQPLGSHRAAPDPLASSDHA